MFESEAALQLPAGSPELGPEKSLEAMAAMGTSPQLLTRVAGRPGCRPCQAFRVPSPCLWTTKRVFCASGRRAGTAVGAHDLLTWAQEFVTRSAPLVQAAGNAWPLLKQSLQHVAELDTARDALHEFQAAHSISLLQTELERLEAELLRSGTNPGARAVHLARRRERLAYLQEELARQPRTLDVDGAAVLRDR